MNVERPCPCGGSNENCKRCSGRGSYASRPAVLSESVVACRWCTKLFSSALLQEHEGTCSMRRAPSTAVGPTRVLRPSKSVRHQEPTPSLSTVGNRLPARKAPTLNPPTLPIPIDEWLRCKTCNAILKAKSLKRHLRKVHGKKDPLQTKPAGARRKTQAPSRKSTNAIDSATSSKPVVYRSISDDFESDELSDYAIERQLDGSRDYWTYREGNGRFGSYPSFDSFDDESEP